MPVVGPQLNIAVELYVDRGAARIFKLRIVMPTVADQKQPALRRE